MRRTLTWHNKSSLFSRSLSLQEKMIFSSEAPPNFENLLQLNNFHFHEDSNFHISDNGEEKKKKAARIIGWGLRRFTTIVCEKVKAKGTTTEEEVAGEIVADIKNTQNENPQIEFDAKNIRRRIYDAFNVLCSIGIIYRGKKEVQWLGFDTKLEQLQNLKDQRKDVLDRIQKKTTFLQEIQNQYLDLNNLILRNKKLEESVSLTSRIALPFLLVKTSPKATLEIEISEDTRLVHFDFNGTPFTLHDDHSVLKAMRFEREGRAENVNEIILDGSN
ncbi:hypothetical protein LUZ60_008066 [Juncus effusus]|nr:hypothetical protein LUZ60_008066 [Juncus effusus]